MSVGGAAVVVLEVLDWKSSISTDWLGLRGSYRGYPGQPRGVVYSLAGGLAVSFVGIALLRRLLKSNHSGSGNDGHPS